MSSLDLKIPTEVVFVNMSSIGRRQSLMNNKISAATKTKVCTACERRKLRSAFHKQASARDGLRYECKACNKSRALAAYHADPQRYIAVQRAWQERNPQKIAEYRAIRRSRQFALRNSKKA